ncbi:unnamed protein product [Heligmosomoides polygyrus]|uniref:Cytochrom_C_asm domain-containing protein n=1 Tax=Heligmosomoides polygyrus TaxID=6339 RepID=A0A183FGU8_HELPZ|nr:unnamed protein product [Heligmosomoides polygyrus]
MASQLVRSVARATLSRGSMVRAFSTTGSLQARDDIMEKWPAESMFLVIASVLRLYYSFFGITLWTRRYTYSSELSSGQPPQPRDSNLVFISRGAPLLWAYGTLTTLYGVFYPSEAPSRPLTLFATDKHAYITSCSD